MSRLTELMTIKCPVAIDPETHCLVHTTDKHAPRDSKVTDEQREKLLLVEYKGQGYACIKYFIHNWNVVQEHQITDNELFDICDGGHNFGGRLEGHTVVVYID